MVYLFAAYTVIWTLLFVFLLYLHRRQEEVQLQLEHLLTSGGESGEADSRVDAGL